MNLPLVITKNVIWFQTFLPPNRAVVSGKTFRAVAVVTVWNGNNSETITVTSGSVKAP